MSDQILSVTEKGEAVVTTDLLLGILGNAIRHAYAVDDLGGPASSYICATLNLLGSGGFIELKGARKRTVDTASPPSWITDAFKTEGGGDAKTDI